MILKQSEKETGGDEINITGSKCRWAMTKMIVISEDDTDHRTYQAG